MRAMFDLVARLRLQDDFSSRMRKVTDQMTRAERATRNLADGVKRFSSQVAGIASAIGVTAAVASGFRMIRNSLDTAFRRIDTMEQFERVMNVMIGDTEKVNKVLEKTREAVTGTAYTLDGAARSVQSFVTRGIDVDKATRYIEAWGDAVAFYGDGSQETFDNVNDALGKMMSKGKVTMDQLDRIMHAGIPAIDIYADKMGMSANQVMDALSKGTINAQKFVDVVTDAMMEGGNKFGSIAGAAKDAGASWGSVFANMRTHIATGVEEVIKAIDKMLKDNGLPQMRDMIRRFGETFRDNLKALAANIPNIAAQIKEVVKWLEPWYPLITKIAKGIALAVGAIAGLWTALAGFKLAGAALSFLATPVGLIFAGVTALSVAFQTAYEKSEAFRQKIEGLHNTLGRVKEFILTMKDVVMSLWYDTGEVGDLFKKLGLSPEQAATAEKVVTGIIDSIKKAVGFVNALRESFMSLWYDTGEVSDILKNFGFSPEQAKQIGDLITNIYNGIAEFIGRIRNIVSELIPYLKAKWDEIKPSVLSLVDILKNAGMTLGDIFATFWNVAGPILSSLWDIIQQVGDVAAMVFNNIVVPAVAYLWQAFQTAWNIIGPILRLLGAAIEVNFAVLKFVWNTILKPVTAFLLGEFKNTLESAKSILETVGGVFEWLGDKISIVVGWLKSVAEWFRNIKVPDWVTKIGGAVGSFLAGGRSESFAANSHYHGIDYVPRDGYIARLHKGERVLTAEENRTYSQSKNVTIAKLADQIVVREEADIEKIAYKLARLIEQEEARMA